MVIGSVSGSPGVSGHSNWWALSGTTVLNLGRTKLREDSRLDSQGRVGFAQKVGTKTDSGNQMVCLQIVL